jgi:hypothetical protein
MRWGHFPNGEDFVGGYLTEKSLDPQKKARPERDGQDSTRQSANLPISLSRSKANPAPGTVHPQVERCLGLEQVDLECVGRAPAPYTDLCTAFANLKRDCVLQPRVARNELPRVELWDRIPLGF